MKIKIDKNVPYIDKHKRHKEWIALMTKMKKGDSVALKMGFVE